jgi:hypothetical protein
MNRPPCALALTDRAAPHQRIVNSGRLRETPVRAGPAPAPDAAFPLARKMCHRLGRGQLALGAAHLVLPMLHSHDVGIAGCRRASAGRRAARAGRGAKLWCAVRRRALSSSSSPSSSSPSSSSPPPSSSSSSPPSLSPSLSLSLSPSLPLSPSLSLSRARTRVAQATRSLETYERLGMWLELNTKRLGNGHGQLTRNDRGALCSAGLTRRALVRVSSSLAHATGRWTASGYRPCKWRGFGVSTRLST